MFSKLLLFFFTILQNQEFQATADELTRLKREDNLTQLVSLLTIALIIVLAILTFALIQNHKLNKENLKLNKQIND